MGSSACLQPGRTPPGPQGTGSAVSALMEIVALLPRSSAGRRTAGERWRRLSGHRRLPGAARSQRLLSGGDRRPGRGKHHARAERVPGGEGAACQPARPTARRARRSAGQPILPTTDHAGRRCRSVYRVDSQRSRRTGAAASARVPVAPQRLGERFHAAPALIEELNPGRTIRRGANHQGPGGRAVRRHGEAGDPAESGWSAGPRRVSREGSLKVFRDDGSLAMFAPVTSGSEHDPLPIGQWKVLLGQLDAAVQLQPRPLLARLSVRHEGHASSRGRTIRSVWSDRYRQGALRHPRHT